MNITPKHTVEDIMLSQAALFAMGNEKIYKAVKDLPMPESIRLKIGKFGSGRDIPIRKVRAVSMQELDTIQNRKTGYDYFCTSLAVMLQIDEEEVKNLQFIKAYRYFIEIQKELKQTAQEWKKLDMPLRPDEKKAKVKRPNRGMVSICRQYVQIMKGSVTIDEAWKTPWMIVYEAFEGAFYDNLEQRRLSDIMMSKTRKHR